MSLGQRSILARRADITAVAAKARASDTAGRACGADKAAVQRKRWRRIELASGVELHLREPLAADLRERVAQLIEQARSLLNSDQRRE